MTRLLLNHPRACFRARRACAGPDALLNGARRMPAIGAQGTWQRQLLRLLALSPVKEAAVRWPCQLMQFRHNSDGAHAGRRVRQASLEERGPFGRADRERALGRHRAWMARGLSNKAPGTRRVTWLTESEVPREPMKTKPSSVSTKLCRLAY